MSKLGLFILQAYKHKYEKAKPRPLIVSVSNPEKKTNLVIAVLGPNQASQRNSFGDKFRRTAHTINIATTHDGFDTAMLEMRTHDWKAFIEKLADDFK